MNEDKIDVSKARNQNMMTNTIFFGAMRPEAILPTYGSQQAIGLDISACFSTGDSVTILPSERALIKTGLSVAVPHGYYGRLAPRSGLAHKHGIDTMAGVIDSDYRGEIGVILVNLGHAPFIVNHGDRIAQFIIERADQMIPTMIEHGSLLSTDRGSGGFGSTGRR